MARLEKLSYGLACFLVLMVVLNLRAGLWIPAVLLIVPFLAQLVFLAARYRARLRAAP